MRRPVNAAVARRAASCSEAAARASELHLRCGEDRDLLRAAQPRPLEQRGGVVRQAVDPHRALEDRRQRDQVLVDRPVRRRPLGDEGGPPALEHVERDLLEAPMPERTVKDPDHIFLYS